MNQLFIAGNVAYPLAAADYMALANGAIGIFDKAGALVSTALSGKTEFVSLVLGRGTKQPLVINEVDLKTLSVVKGAYVAATTFASTMTIPTPTAGKEYGIIVIKKGTVFNERNTWTFLELAKTGDTAATVAARIVKAIKANTASSGVTASNVDGAITITAVEAGVDYTVVGAEALFGVAPNAVTQGIAAYGDAKYVQTLASKAASGKGNGNPADVLLTLLDNVGFTDNYIECMIPTSGVYPIATANDKSQISAPLMSRFAVIDIPDYTSEEKKVIFSKFALPKILKRMSLKESECIVSPEALDTIIEKFSDTTGIRDLEQAAEHIAANALYQIEVNHVSSVTFDAAMVNELFD